MTLGKSFIHSIICYWPKNAAVWLLSKCGVVQAMHQSLSGVPICSGLTAQNKRSAYALPWSPPLIDFQSSRRPPVALCYCRRSVVCYCRPSTLEQSTCWCPVCLVTYNISRAPSCPEIPDIPEILKLSWNQKLSWNFSHLVRMSWYWPLLCRSYSIVFILYLVTL